MGSVPRGLIDAACSVVLAVEPPQPSGRLHEDLWQDVRKLFRPYRPDDLPAALGALTEDTAFANGFFAANVEGE